LIFEWKPEEEFSEEIPYVEGLHK